MLNYFEQQAACLNYQQVIEQKRFEFLLWKSFLYRQSFGCIANRTPPLLNNANLKRKLIDEDELPPNKILKTIEPLKYFTLDKNELKDDDLSKKILPFGFFPFKKREGDKHVHLCDEAFSIM